MRHDGTVGSRPMGLGAWVLVNCRNDNGDTHSKTDRRVVLHGRLVSRGRFAGPFLLVGYCKQRKAPWCQISSVAFGVLLSA